MSINPYTTKGGQGVKAPTAYDAWVGQTQGIKCDLRLIARCEVQASAPHPARARDPRPDRQGLSERRSGRGPLCFQADDRLSPLEHLHEARGAEQDESAAQSGEHGTLAIRAIARVLSLTA